MGDEVRIGGDGDTGGAVLEVQPRVVELGRDHAEGLDAEASQFFGGAAELGDVAAAEGAIQADEDGEQQVALSAVVGERDFALAVHRGQGEVGSGFADHAMLAAAARSSSSLGNFPTPAMPSLLHSTLAQRTMPSASMRNWPLS